MTNIDKHTLMLKEKAYLLPDAPGVYQYINNKDEIIYVGKAKNIKKRVLSYFNKNHENTKTRILVKNIKDINHIVVETEQDALLLENNLIKKYKPRYNVLLKDDKTYPWICIKNEPFPRVISTRQHDKNGGIYFGPYTSIKTLRVMLDFIHQLYPLRTCALNLDSTNISKNRYKVCLDYHIGTCLAPCIGKQTETEYNHNINHIKDILKGNINYVIKTLNSKMHEYSAEYKFEEAQLLKEKLNHLRNYQSKSTIVSNSIHNVDVFSFIEDENSAYVNYLKVINGAVTQVYTMEIKKRIEEDKESLLLTAITEIRQKLHSTSKEIIVPFNTGFEIEGITFTEPQRGDKKKLLDLSMRNAYYFKKNRIDEKLKRSPKKKIDRIMNTMQKDLRLKQQPTHIEGFDNSNIQGTNPVASCVVFKNGKPSKRDYRHFNIKTVVGANDFASMEEIIYRRYKRLLDEKTQLPQLIVIDGGKGQLGAAVNSLQKLNLIDKIAVIGIAKRLEEIFFPGDPVPIYLDKNSETLKIIQHIRNESHRFGVTFHRLKRSNNFIKSELHNISGIGNKIVEKLLKEFKSVDVIKNKSIDELSSIVGNVKAVAIFEYFNKKSS
jgi:excinuclease ABC subunit C